MPRYATYDQDGTIVTLTDTGDIPEGIPQPVLPPTDDHEVVELVLDDETRDLDDGELVQRYRVDPETKELVRRDS
jgi:hypothetical protein